MVAPEPLSGTVGNVLDPIVSLRQSLVLGAGGEAQLTFLLGAAAERKTALALAAAYAEAARVEAAFEAAAHAGPLAAPIPPPSSPIPAGIRAFSAPGAQPVQSPTPPLIPEEPLHFWNGHGGFSADGREYVIRLQPDANGRLRLPPQPWTNVIANPQFGFLASETGAGYTWSQNSRENRLTPWYNDPVLDPHGEALYARDEASGAVWSLLPGPIPQPVAYEVRHGFGYSRYRHASHNLEHEICLFVPREEPVKL
ncbi:MAG: glycosyl transferase, partial [Candidatus Competibacter sp.]|nr:glycosyl transferase [Candidatus Competibacter sp.]